jgi:hypothetical protein
MRRIQVLTATVGLIWIMVASAGAQTITSYDNRGARASLKVGYGGHGIDVEPSIESPLMADLLRVRGGVGWGRWDSEFDSYDNPTITRLAASGLVYIPTRNTLKPYVGLGFSAYVPRGTDMRTQTGARLILGAEGSGDGWTVGGEVEIDVPRTARLDRPPGGNYLFPMARVGLAIRRHF